MKKIVKVNPESTKVKRMRANSNRTEILQVIYGGDYTLEELKNVGWAVELAYLLRAGIIIEVEKKKGRKKGRKAKAS